MSEPNRHSGHRRFLRFFERLLKIIILFLLAIEKFKDLFN